jgi:hypothetical protein
MQHMTERTKTAQQTVCDFWQTYGVAIQEENGPGSFKHAFVREMMRLHDAVTDGVHGAVIDRTMRDILAQQQTHMIQFESCLDEFNRYLAALRLLCAL